MDKERVKRIAESPRIIKGIYNYCDRWCERCAFTSRCTNFALANEQFADPASRDIKNAVFWQKLSETLKETLELLKERAEREGIDLDSIHIEESQEQERLQKEVIESHECCRLAKAYADMVSNWFDAAGELFAEDQDKVDLNAQFNIPDVSAAGESSSLEEAVQVVRWYQHQIHVKLMRAIRGTLNEVPGILDEFAKDSDGSAKIALIAIDRSIAAWGEIQKHFFLYEREILELLVHLERLRRIVESVFPDARAFVRPGFDKKELSS